MSSNYLWLCSNFFLWKKFPTKTKIQQLSLLVSFSFRNDDLASEKKQRQQQNQWMWEISIFDFPENHYFFFYSIFPWKSGFHRWTIMLEKKSFFFSGSTKVFHFCLFVWLSLVHHFFFIKDYFQNESRVLRPSWSKRKNFSILNFATYAPPKIDR